MTDFSEPIPDEPPPAGRPAAYPAGYPAGPPAGHPAAYPAGYPGGPQAGYPAGPPAGPWSPPASRAPQLGPGGRRSAAATITAILGLAATFLGLFVLPLSSYAQPGSDIGYVEIRSIAAQLSGGRRLPGYSSFGADWWRFGALLSCGLLVALTCATVAFVAQRWLGWALAAVAVASGVVQVIAPTKFPDYRSLQIRFDASVDMYAHAGAGLYVAPVGFAVVAAAGLLVALRRPTR